MPNPLKPVQLAYHVADPERAAHAYAVAFGWGPFFLFEHIPLSRCVYRGRAGLFDHSSAYGQAGDLMIELIAQHDDTPSVLRDLFPRDAVGLHHMAHFVPDLGEALARAREHGHEVALDACTESGTSFAMLDMSGVLGHMIEIYESAGDLAKFYRYVKRAADGWNGSDPVRRLLV